MARFSATLFLTAITAAAGFVAAAPTTSADTTIVHVADVAFDRPAETTPSKRDMTSAWSKYIGTTDGSSVTGACNVPYNDHSHGACVDNIDLCGHSVYAYLGSGSQPQFQTHATVVDVCDDLGPNDIYFTLDSFEELGGTETGGVIRNVNWKFLN